MKNNIIYKGNINNTSVIIFLIGRQKLPAMLLCLGEPPVRFLLLLLLFISFLHLVFILLFSFIHLLFGIISHPSVDYRRVFAPILYFQPSPSQSDLRYFHFQPFRYLLTASAAVLGGHFFALRPFTDILPAFIRASLGSGSSFLKFAGLNTDPRNTGPVHILHIQNNLFLNSVKYHHELLVVKV